MRGKIAQYPLSLVLTIIGSVFAFFLLFLFAVGVLVGLLVEMVKFNSRRTVYSKLKPVEYKVPEVIILNNFKEKTEKKGKILKLPLPEPVRSERMAYAREK